MRGHCRPHYYACVVDRRRRSRRANLEWAELERSRHDFGRRDSGGAPRADCAMELRFVRSRFDSERSAVIGPTMAIASISPATGEKMKEFAAFGDAELDRRLTSCADAFEDRL